MADPTLVKVKQFTQIGRPTTVADEQLRFYWSKRDEISIEASILLWDSRVIVPSHAGMQQPARLLKRLMLHMSR